MNTRWQKILAEGFSSAAELLKFLELPVNLGSIEVEQQFRTRVPRGFAERMEKGNPKDPLLLQVLATAAELAVVEGYVVDPLKEEEANPLPGLIHKYAGRVLVMLTGACAVNCRYCFRRHFPYAENTMNPQNWEAILDYLQQDPSLKEVILSGGDPLLAGNAVFKRILPPLEAISHIKTLRIHTRLPIVLPERIDEEFLEIMKATPLRKVMVLHSNHPNEIDKNVVNAVDKLRKAGFFMLNQSVLLKEVNDDAAILAALSERLFDAGVLPYYLHVLDKVAGGAHFDISTLKVSKVYKTLQNQISGYLLPQLVKEEPMIPHKVLIIY